jgi:16S rRNA (uracil1498-N3)-methyltransferase
VGQVLRLGGEERHYLGRVLRARLGESVRIADGLGHGRVSILRSFDGEEALLEIQSVADDVAEPWILHLALCPPRGDAFEEAQEAAVQLGAQSLILLKSQRTLANFDGAALQGARLAKRMQEACRQCERSAVPPVLGPVDLEAFLAGPLAGLRLIASERGGLPLNQALQGVAAGTEIHSVVGPEGGFSSQELAAASQQGWTPVTLGPRALRVPVAVAALMAGLRTLQPQSSGPASGPWKDRA